MKLSRDQSRRGWFLIVVLAAGMFGIMIPVAHAVTKTAVGTGTNDWFADATWSPSNPPVAGDDVVITNNDLYVFLTNATPYLGSLVISNRATLICSNWNTSLSATNVSILTDAVLTCAGPFTNSVMSNRVYLICSNLTIDSGGKIDTDSKGYWAFNGPGAGGGTWRGGGGGHGGWGGSSLGNDTAYGGAPYDSASDPTAPGSGGGATYYTNSTSHGGGAVKIEAGGTVTVNGTITADGGEDTAGTAGPVGGGSGGAISISCDTFAGTSSGLISVDGGSTLSADDESGGGGGRIAVVYTTMTPGTAVRFSTASGSSGWHESDLDSRWHAAAEWGTLYLADTTLLSSNMYDQLFYKTRLIIPGFSSWSPVSLTVSNCSFQLGTNGFMLNVTNDLVIIGTNGILWLGGDYQSATTTVNVGQNLVLTNGGALHVYSGNTNADNPDQGALVDVGQNIRIGSGSWLYPYCQLTNGGGVLFRAQNVTIATNAGINAAGRGFEGSKGYGVGGGVYRGGGGGYGGKGGNGDQYDGSEDGGPTYGLSNAPTFAGSGGGCSYYSLRTRACGGGMIRIETANNVIADGTLSASGATAILGLIGGGSGGSILIMCNSFAGNVNGQLLAKGGSTGSSGGGGGGGRIAVWYKVPESVRAKLLAGQVVRDVITSTNYSGFEGTTSVSNGTGMLNPPDPDGAYPGTCVFLTYAPRGTTISIQ